MSSPRAESPGTCLVLGVETQIGLGIVRELGQAGVRVVAITTQPGSIGAVSRYVSRVVKVASLQGAETLCTIRALGESIGPCSLITVSEANLIWLIEHADALGPAVHPALPPAEAFSIVRDKDRTLRIAASVGIDVPFTEEPRTFEELRNLAPAIRYPAVLKWSGRNDVSALLDRHELAFVKAEYVYNAAELLAVGERYRPLGCFPMIQEYCAGQGLGQFFFIHGDAVVQRFQHRRIAEWPPEGGFSSVCDAVPLDQYQALQAKSIALLKAIGWQGVAMVEYRVDERTDRAVLMEINGRFWGSFPLAYHAGARFAWIAHRAALGLPLDKVPAPRNHLRCRMVVTEIKRLVRIVAQRVRIKDRSFAIRPVYEILRFFADFVRPNVCYYVWSCVDPKPFVADVRNGLMKVFESNHGGAHERGKVACGRGSPIEKEHGR